VTAKSTPKRRERSRLGGDIGPAGDLLLAERARRVRGGKPSIERRRDAIVLLEALRECVDLGKPIPSPLRDYLGLALRRILDFGATADRAFRLDHPPHRGSRDVSERDLSIAVYVAHHKSRGMASGKAEKAAATKFSMDPRSIQRIVADHPDIAMLTQEELRALLPSGE
jgi:hypothetical protein